MNFGLDPMIEEMRETVARSCMRGSDTGDLVFEDRDGAETTLSAGLTKERAMTTNDGGLKGRRTRSSAC